MTEQQSDLQVPSDAELISRVRGGEIAAYGDLFSRHRDAANRLARHLIHGPDADDLVADGFVKVLRILQRGGGPDVAFRAYLLTAVRRLHVDKIRSSAKLHSSDDMSRFDPGVPFTDTAVSNFENSAAAKAFASLPERWQLVLWHLEVEGQKPAEIAPLLGISANSVSALAYRAREGLRQAFLTMHLSDISADDCRWVIERLGGYVRKGLSRRDHTKVHDHLDECRRCTAMYLELTEVNSNLAGIIAPLLLGGAAAGYVASNSAGAAAGLLAVVGRLRDTVVTNAGVVAAGAVAAGVVAAATAGILIAGSDDENLAAAEQPRVSTQPALPDSAPTDGLRSSAPELRITRGAEASPPASPDAVAPDGARSSSTTPTPTATAAANDLASPVPS
ncbi:MAG TPA: sigma-70 family RNA polymerase sigma factor, partial [Nocardioidaceae bacterium]|nr:sigma-70 family RNA polymerase sigma factor [Nocardioidaceae bacterium]